MTTPPRPIGSSNRTFGLVFAAVFLIVALLPLWHGAGARLWSLGVAAAFLVTALVTPAVLAPLNRAWTAFGNLLHRLVSPVALAILFFGVVTPTALIMRLLKKDLLRLRFEPAARSYWLDRQPPGPSADSLKDQF